MHRAPQNRKLQTTQPPPPPAPPQLFSLTFLFTSLTDSLFLQQLSTMVLVKFFNSMSKTKAIGVSFAAASAVTTVCYSALQSTATPLRTMTPQWNAATKDYGKFQKQEPMKIS